MKHKKTSFSFFTICIASVMCACLPVPAPITDTSTPSGATQHTTSQATSQTTRPVMTPTPVTPAITPFPTYAPAPESAFIYQKSHGEVTITGYQGTGGDVGIPDSIEGQPVTRIGDAAFHAATNLVRLSLPDSLTSIGFAAFFECSNLTDVRIGVQLAEIDYSVFASCNSLENIHVADENPYYSSRNGVLFNKTGTELILFPQGRQGSYTIPDGVIQVSAQAFAVCNLNHVSIPDSVLILGDLAFYGSTALRQVDGGQGLESIGTQAFYGCGSLVHVTIPDSVTIIHDAAFAACGNLQTIEIGRGLMYLSTSAFSRCSRLMQISVSAENPNLMSHNGVLFNKQGTELILFPKGRQGSYTVIDTVLTIGEYAFADSQLRHVILPDSVTWIAGGAFRESPNLSEVILGTGVDRIGQLAFYASSRLSRVVFSGPPPSDFFPDAFHGCSPDLIVSYPKGVSGWTNPWHDLKTEAR